MTTFYWIIGLIIAVLAVMAYFGDRIFDTVDEAKPEDYGV